MMLERPRPEPETVLVVTWSPTLEAEIVRAAQRAPDAPPPVPCRLDCRRRVERALRATGGWMTHAEVKAAARLGRREVDDALWSFTRAGKVSRLNVSIRGRRRTGEQQRYAWVAR